MAHLIAFVLLLVAPATAFADPISVTIFFSELGIGAVGVWLADHVGALVISALIARGVYEGHRQRERAREAYNRSLQDRTVTIRSGVSTRKYVVGTHRVGGTLMYVDSIGPNKTMLDSIVALAGNKCQLLSYFFNDEQVGADEWPAGRYATVDTLRGTVRPAEAVGPGLVEITLDHEPVPGTTSVVLIQEGMPIDASPSPIYTEGNGVTVTGKKVSVTLTIESRIEVNYSYAQISGSKLLPQFIVGDADQPASTWEHVEAPGWTADHKLSGICYIRTLMVWDEKIYSAGAPQVSCIVKGGGVAMDANDPSAVHRFYDPRDDSEYDHSDNPALVALWWMTLPARFGGCGIPQSMIDLASVSAAANVCDELVSAKPLDGEGSLIQMRRYRCHGVLDTERSPLENLDIILSSMDGSRAFPGAGGKWRIFAGAWRPAEHTITDDDIVGDADFAVTTGQQEAPKNVVKARFVDHSKMYMESSAPIVRNETYIAEDGAEEVLELTLECTTDPRDANYLMGIALERSRPHFAASLTIGGKGENIAVGDIIEFDLEGRSQYDGKTFEVLRITDRWNGTFEIECVETKPTTWTLNPDNYLPTGAGQAPDTSHLWNVARVMGLAVSYGSPQVIGGGLTMTRMTITWDQHSQQYVRDTGKIELRYRQIGTDEWRGIPEVPGNAVGTTYTAALVDGAAYEVQARARNGNGAVSDWASTLDAVNGVLAAGQIRIIASAISFRVDVYGAGSPSLIELEAALSGPLTGPVTWEVVGSGAATVVTTGDTTATLAYEDMEGQTVSIRATATYRGVDFSDLITIIKVNDGATGERGETGAAGSLTGYGAAYGMTPSSWDDQLANRVIYNMLTNGTSAAGLADTSHLLIGDTVTLSNGTDFAETRFWDGAGSWLLPGMVINGNLLVNGTVSATKLTAGEILAGTAGNARIRIGSNTFIGSAGGTLLTSPLHVEKASTKANQVLISAMNDKDDSVAIWGANATSIGNAVSGTWHATATDAQFSRWQMIGVLGAAGAQFDGAVAGSAYGQKQAAAFRYFDGASSATPGTAISQVGLCRGSYAILAAGISEFLGAGSPLRMDGDDGEAGQVLTSNGPGLTPSWTTVSGGGGSVTYTQIQTAMGAAASALNLPATFRATGVALPSSGAGLEIAYDAGAGYVISYDRTAGAYKPLNVSGSAVLITGTISIEFSRAPTFPTPATGTNNTTAATTAYVVSRIAQDAPTKSGSGATGTWPINITGNSNYSTTSGTANAANTANRVLGYKCFGGQGAANGSGNFTVNFPEAFTSANTFGVSAVSTDENYVVVTAVSASSVTFQVQARSTGNPVASAGIRWTAVGT